jgi:hypothetical protein
MTSIVIITIAILIQPYLQLQHFLQVTFDNLSIDSLITQNNGLMAIYCPDIQIQWKT